MALAALSIRPATVLLANLGLRWTMTKPKARSRSAVAPGVLPITMCSLARLAFCSRTARLGSFATPTLAAIPGSFCSNPVDGGATLDRANWIVLACYENRKGVAIHAGRKPGPMEGFSIQRLPIGGDDTLLHDPGTVPVTFGFRGCLRQPKAVALDNAVATQEHLAFSIAPNMAPAGLTRSRPAQTPMP